MRVAFASSEMLPFSKTGGLADVASALPAELASLGCEVLCFTPLHRSARTWLAEHAVETERLELPEPVLIGERQQALAYQLLKQDDLGIVFVEHDVFFDRPHLYLDEGGSDYQDNPLRYSYYCRAILEYLLATEWMPDVIHANDWQAALLPVYLRTLYRKRLPTAIQTVFTIHNLGYQGVFPKEQLAALGLSWDLFTPEKLEFYDSLNLLKGGIAYADWITTVSPAYAREIQTAELGHGLNGLLRQHRKKLSGILNGIDMQVWNPATDPYIETHYSAQRITGKKQAKRKLQLEMGLPTRQQALLLGAVTRFDRQKGIELILSSFRQCAALDLQLVLLGSGAKEYEAQALALAAEFPGQVAVQVGYNEGLAHRIEAGADAFLMPSLYEPCGLNQLYSQRYGTVPIVRQTGGLEDTVVNYSPARQKDRTASGFSFGPFATANLTEAIRRAAQLYFAHPTDWRKLVRRIMKIDHSWRQSAEAYFELYELLTAGIDKEAD